MSEIQRKSVLILDDKIDFADTLRGLLEGEHYQIHLTTSVNDAIKLLGQIAHPTFILADRMLEGQAIEINYLERFSGPAVGSHIVIYTMVGELTDEQIYTIQNRGAIRVIDRSELSSFVEDIKLLTQEFDELLEISQELQATTDRSKLVAALVGSDVGVTVIDRHFHCWFANAAQERIVGQPCSGNLCWKLFHAHPVVSGPCWGCTVKEVLDLKTGVERLFLSRFANGSVKWVSVRSIPIFSQTGEIIAVREGVSDSTDAVVENLSLNRRLHKIAQGLIHIGFGRVRIYEIKADNIAVLTAAASQSDNPRHAEGEYLQELQNIVVEMSLNYDECPYAREAWARRIGLFVPDWNSKWGPSPFADLLNLEPPYFIIPVSLSDDELNGFLSIDFGALEDVVREESVKRYAKEETLTWLQVHYAGEIKKAFESRIQPGQRRLYEMVQRARIGIGAARSVDSAMKELRGVFRDFAKRDLFKMGLEFQKDLDNETFSRDLRRQFKDNGFTLGRRVTISTERGLNIWIISDEDNKKQYIVEREEEKLNIYALTCRISVRILDPDENELKEYEELCFGPRERETYVPEIIKLEDKMSLAAQAVKKKQASWIDNYPIYKDEAEETNQPTGYSDPDVLSCAHIPLMIENTVFGSLSIDSQELIHWENGYKRPLLNPNLSYLVALVVRDVALNEKIEQKSADLTSMTAYSMNLSGDAIWRHWAAQRLIEATAIVYRCRKLLKRRDNQDKLDELLLKIREIVEVVLQGRPLGQVDGSCSLIEVVKNLKQIYQDSRFPVTFELPKELPIVEAPRFHVQNILQILLDNAIQAIKESGIGTGVRLTVRQNDSFVEIEVRDDGPGIPEAIKDKVLKEPIESKKGRGVGLLVARGTALQYGGNLILCPTEVGACFILKLPLS